MTASSNLKKGELKLIAKKKKKNLKKKKKKKKEILKTIQLCQVERGLSTPRS